MIQNQNEMEVQKLLFGKETKLNLIIKQPDYQYIHKELLRPGTNIRLLWEEYAEDCRNSKFPFYQYSYFCEKYRDYVNKNAQFKKIVALSNLIQRIYHNDIRNMLP